MLWHMTHYVHDDTPLAPPKVRIADNFNQSETIRQANWKSAQGTCAGGRQIAILVSMAS
jgi:hypothetical protein